MLNRNKSKIRILVLVALVLILAFPVAAQDDMNELVIRVAETFTSLDTLGIGSSGAHKTFVYGLHEPLIRLELDGSFTPVLATDWSISDDKLTITMSLREGVVFHDGTPFNAEAAAWNIEAAKSAEIGDITAGYQSIDSVDVLDEYTIQINMAQPDANILIELAAGGTTQALLASPTAYETMGPDVYSINPVGTGPFKFASWEPGVEVVAVPFDDYWGENDSNVDRVVFRVILDNSAATLNYQSGDIHALSEVLATQLPILETVAGTVVEYMAQGVNMLTLNTQKAPFDNVHNRRAVRYAIDAEPVINLVYGGLAQPARGIVPPNAWSYNPDAPAMITRDLDAARAELEAAGNPEGFEFNVSVVAQPYRIQVLEIMQASLAEVGINLIIQANERARHVEVLVTGPDFEDAGFVQVLQHFAAPEAYLYRGPGCNARIKQVQYCTEEYDNLEKSLPGIFDLEERAAALQQMDQIGTRDVAVIPYLYTVIPWVYRGDILENVGLNGIRRLDWVNIRFREE